MRGRRWLGVQLAFWTLYGVAHFLAILPAIAPAERGAMALANLVRAASGLGITSAVWPALRGAVREGRTRRLVLLGIGLVVVGLVVWPVFDRAILVTIATASGVAVPWVRFPRGLDLEYLIVLLGWSAGAVGALVWAREREAREALLEERATAREAQVRALAARLEPHFLFNALNTVRALVTEDPERARTVLTRLAGFLRHALAVDPAVPATLDQEIAAARHYLRIEEARFEPDLRIDVRVDAAAGDVLVPSLVLQPLVENAIHHGAPDPDGVLLVRVHARIDGAALRIEVENGGTLDPSPDGIGLDLTRTRLRQMYGDDQRFELRERDGRVVAVVELPAPRRAGRPEAPVP